MPLTPFQESQIKRLEQEKLPLIKKKSQFQEKLTKAIEEFTIYMDQIDKEILIINKAIAVFSEDDSSLIEILEDSEPNELVDNTVLEVSIPNDIQPIEPVFNTQNADKVEIKVIDTTSIIEDPSDSDDWK